ncbi:MAG: hypothetical protein ABI051_14470 [Vicinamibacterales bacterium]
MSRRLLWIAIWVVSILATAQYVKAQREALPANPMSNPLMVSGTDLAFRVQSYGPDAARGRFMIRINGTWQPIEVVSPGAEK